MIGDLGATLIIVLFAYLAASKIVVRKVALADAKVRTAEDAAGREAMERQLVQARLQVLQAQVEPHFLFNTLAAVDYLIETDPARATQMQKALITYLRGALPQMRQESSTLGREMRLVRSYLELIKMRIEDRLELQYEVPAELEAAEFPPMMLQSLVENAIKHGIEPKPEGGKVTVAARVQKGSAGRSRCATPGSASSTWTSWTARPRAPASGCRTSASGWPCCIAGKGHLSLMSDSTMGTTVRIAVPFQHRPGAGRRRVAAGDGAGGMSAGAATPLRALVADDERLLREQLKTRLAAAWPDLQVVGEARDGLEALAQAEALQPDVVFLDIRMPGMTGIEAAREIVALPGWKGEIVFVTAYDEYAVAAFEQGVAGLPAEAGGSRHAWPRPPSG